jgi:predicted  nucleic acid-binding Zn-ribbon protein
MTRACPSCPDGNEWTASGPTGRACPTCGGQGYLPNENAADAAQERAVAEEAESDLRRDDRLTGDWGDDFGLEVPF